MGLPRLVGAQPADASEDASGLDEEEAAADEAARAVEAEAVNASLLAQRAGHNR